jgi:hypothetical protein
VGVVFRGHHAQAPCGKWAGEGEKSDAEGKT